MKPLFIPIILLLLLSSCESVQVWQVHTKTTTEKVNIQHNVVVARFYTLENEIKANMSLREIQKYCKPYKYTETDGTYNYNRTVTRTYTGIEQ